MSLPSQAQSSTDATGSNKAGYAEFERNVSCSSKQLVVEQRASISWIVVKFTQCSFLVTVMGMTGEIHDMWVVHGRSDSLASCVTWQSVLRP